MTRKIPVIKKKFILDGDYVGWEFTARTNMPIGQVEKMQSGDVGKIIDAFCKIILEWNFVDENGQELPPPSDRMAMEQLPTDLINLMVSKIGQEIGAVPNA